MKNVRTTRETDTGLNTHFNQNGRDFTRGQFVNEIKRGVHPDYHVRMMNGKNIPCSNPDTTHRNNLG